MAVHVDSDSLYLREALMYRRPHPIVLAAQLGVIAFHVGSDL